MNETCGYVGDLVYMHGHMTRSYYMEVIRKWSKAC